MDDELSNQLRQAASLLQAGDLKRAAALVAQLKKKDHATGDVWALDGEIAIRQGRLADALAAVDKAARLESHLPDRHIQRARCQVLAGLSDEARISARHALKSDITRPDHLLILGGVLVRCGEHAEALQVYLKAAAVAPQNPDVFRGLASVYRFLGELQKAEHASDRAIHFDPHDYEMINLRSSLREQTRESNHIDSLIELQTAGIRNWRGEVHVAYALAKEYEDIGEYDLSFTALERGARIKRQHTRYNHADDLGIFKTLKSAYSREKLEEIRHAGHPTTDPIFVLGMPRTGSTLVERIISSHSQVQNAGEISSFSTEMVALAKHVAGHERIERLALAELSLSLPMKTLAENYLAAVAPIRNGSPKFVDKLPLNCLNIGLIYAAMPNAKIVHVVRHPMDSCYAMYKYLFKNGYPFSYHLGELAAYYIEYDRLMKHWRAALPTGHIYDIYYEDLVADLSGQTRKLLDYLCLEWEEACENFYTNKQASTTGSASQVRQPIYRSSMGKWRMFERHLGPLRSALEGAGIRID